MFILMVVWAGLKLVQPERYVGIYQAFYGAEFGTSVVYVIGIVQVAFLLAYLLGTFKTITTGAVMLMNLASLVVSLPKMLPTGGSDPNLLFVASVPVFGASLAHFLMRKQDTLLSFGKS